MPASAPGSGQHGTEQTQPLYVRFQEAGLSRTEISRERIGEISSPERGEAERFSCSDISPKISIIWGGSL